MEIASNIHLIPGLVGTRPLQLYLLNGPLRRVLLDTGCAPDPERMISPYLHQIGLDLTAIDMVINTHCDLDHCGGNHALKKANPQLQLTCSEADRPLIENPQTMWDLRYNAYHSEHGIRYDDLGREAIFAALGQPQPVDWTWTGGETLSLGDNWRVEIHHVPGHSQGHLAVFDPRSGTMLFGDAVHGAVYLDQGGLPALCPTYLQVDHYLETIQYLRSLPIRCLAGCHWPIKRGTEVGTFLDESRAFVEKADQVILAKLSCSPDGKTLRELIDNAGPELGSWPLAANNELVYALSGHLERLVSNGKVTAMADAHPLRYKTACNG
jgi:glyoxylase-like metal-dependent hydrolase (beta-lactamase superfamily II)